MPPHPSARRPWHRTISLILLLAYLPGCTTWEVGTPTPEQFVTREHPDPVRVTLNDGSTLVLGQPTIVHDSLVGTTRVGLAAEDTARTHSIPLSDIRVIEARGSSGGNSLAIVGGVVFGLFLIACATDNSGYVC
ncbi:MAG TPA: hypothetical protein VNH46_04550 [Gemmatimonadales bacterium]|nr:hypothetical protein [Gemmatimonadales bacterium]